MNSPDISDPTTASTSMPVPLPVLDPPVHSLGREELQPDSGGLQKSPNDVLLVGVIRLGSRYQFTTLNAIGKVSYGMYLFHSPMVSASETGTCHRKPCRWH